MTLFFVILSNALIYIIVRAQLARKFRKGYTIYLKDEEGNRQTLTDTIAYLIEQNEVLEKKIMYLAGEMESQWLSIEKIKMVTGADKFCND